MPFYVDMDIDGSNERFVCQDGVSVLRSMECLGRRGIPVGCRGGGCGVCKVRVLLGAYRVEGMSRACVSEVEEQGGVALACKLYPRSDLRLRVVGKMARGDGRDVFQLYGLPSAGTQDKQD